MDSSHSNIDGGESLILYYITLNALDALNVRLYAHLFGKHPSAGQSNA